MLIAFKINLKLLSMSVRGLAALDLIGNHLIIILSTHDEVVDSLFHSGKCIVDTS